MKTNIVTFSLLLGLALSAPAAAGPPCAKNPDHPSCSDGGGGGGGDGGSTANPALAFNDGRDSIDVLDIDGSNQTTLVDGIYGRCTHPRWSPDGERIVYATQGRIIVMDKDGANATDVTPPGLQWSGACAIDWSQGSVLGGDDLIAFVGVPDDLAEQGIDFPESTDYDDVYLLNPDTGASVNLTNSFGVSENAVAWSHDGGRLAVTRVDMSDDNHQRLVVLNLELANGSPAVASELDITPPTPVFNPWNDISWASTSNKIALSLSSGDGPPYVDNLHVATFDSSGLLTFEQITGGANQFNLGSALLAAWSPSDDAIALVVTSGVQKLRPKDTGIYALDLATGTAEQVFKGSPGWPDWKPTWMASP